MSSNELPSSFTLDRRRLFQIAATLSLVGVVGVVSWYAAPPNSSDEATPHIARRERGVPRIPPTTHRVLPLPPNEAELMPRAEIVVDVARDGTLRIDGMPAELDALRSLLAGRQAEAGSIGVTIRTDEECRFYHVRQVIRACDESAGVPYRLRALSEEGSSSSS